MDTEKDNLQSTLDETLKDKKEALAKSSRLLQDSRRENLTLKAIHAKDVTRMQSEIDVGPNSWVEFSFRGSSKNYRTRYYVRRQTEKFHETIADLCKETGRDRLSLSFQHKGMNITYAHREMTLRQVSGQPSDVKATH